MSALNQHTLNSNSARYNIFYLIFFQNLLHQGQDGLDSGRGSGRQIDVLPVGGNAAVTLLDEGGHLATDHLQTGGVCVGAHRLALAALQNGAGALLHIFGIVRRVQQSRLKGKSQQLSWE